MTKPYLLIIDTHMESLNRETDGMLLNWDCFQMSTADHLYAIYPFLL